MRRIKYNNYKTVYDGIEFDSQHEAECYKVLKHRQELGEISDLKRQVSFTLLPTQYYMTDQKTKNSKPKYKAERAVTYIADFTYIDNSTEMLVVADSKSPITRKDKAYILKRKMMLYFHNVHIVEL